ncbi:MAG: 6-carboxytetrahydropterin synthase QueD [Spirochaetes bacterium]|nr:6-carboxytetrahydropterin synthase QueD [Spirochaetota bacterium]
MYFLKTEDSFSSAHALRGYKGKCENIHGHNWRVIVTVKGDKLDEIGLLIDFHELKTYVRDILSVLDHKNINEEVPFFTANNPSSENLASFIYENLSSKLSEYGKNRVIVDSIEVFESEKCSCIYKP